MNVPEEFYFILVLVEHCSQGGLRDRTCGQLPSHHRGRVPCFKRSLGEIEGRATNYIKEILIRSLIDLHRQMLVVIKVQFGLKGCRTVFGCFRQSIWMCSGHR